MLSTHAAETIKVGESDGASDGASEGGADLVGAPVFCAGAVGADVVGAFVSFNLVGAEVTGAGVTGAFDGAGVTGASVTGAVVGSSLAAVVGAVDGDSVATTGAAVSATGTIGDSVGDNVNVALLSCAATFTRRNADTKVNFMIMMILKVDLKTEPIRMVVIM
jgi:hypothetical protein